MKYGGGGSSSNVVIELAFSPPKPKKKISDDVTTFLRIYITKCFRYEGTAKVNGDFTFSGLCDPAEYVDMWVAWTDTYNFSMGLGLEVGSNIVSEFYDATNRNEINTVGFGTWAVEKPLITFFMGKFMRRGYR